EGHGDVGEHADPAGVLGRQEQREEGLVGRLRGVDAVEAELFQVPRGLGGARQVTPDEVVDLHRAVRLDGAPSPGERLKDFAAPVDNGASALKGNGAVGETMSIIRSELIRADGRLRSSRVPLRGIAQVVGIAWVYIIYGGFRNLATGPTVVS